MFLKIVFCAVLSAGLILVSLDIFKIPYLKTSRAVKNLLKKRSKKESAAELWLSGVSLKLSEHIKINEYKRISLADDLASADIPLTPEQFRANAIVKAGGYSGICRSVRLYLPAFVSRFFNSRGGYIYGREPKAYKEIKKAQRKNRVRSAGACKRRRKNLKAFA